MGLYDPRLGRCKPPGVAPVTKTLIWQALFVGDAVGLLVGGPVGAPVGFLVGGRVGAAVGLKVGGGVGPVSKLPNDF
jgi:hypothetical protein